MATAAMPPTQALDDAATLDETVEELCAEPTIKCSWCLNSSPTCGPNGNAWGYVYLHVWVSGLGGVRVCLTTLVGQTDCGTGPMDP